MQLSYWERQTFFNQVDFTIVGSGIVGLSAAIELRKRHPKAKIIVLERGFLPYGASTRNAGFACFGSVTELQDDLRNLSEKEVIALVEKRWKGLQNLKSMLGEERMVFENFGGYEIFKTRSDFEKAEQDIDRLNGLLEAVIGPQVYQRKNDRITSFGFGGIAGMIYNQYESQIDTGATLAALLQKAQMHQIYVIGGITVEKIDHEIITTGQDFSFGGGKILIATNGFAKQFFPEYDVHPARAQVLVTKPIPGLKLKGTFHFDKGYYYFRNVGTDRILLGGGRNLDFTGETTTEMSQTDLIQQALESLLNKTIVPYYSAEIDHRWSGIMGVGAQRMPIIKKVQENLYCAVRLGGMGVAIGSLVGKEAAELMS